MTFAFEQAIKSIPTIGGVEAAAIDGVFCTLAGHYSAALDDSVLVDFLQKIIQSLFRWFNTMKSELPITWAQAYSSASTSAASSEAYHLQWPQCP
jgi:hypothetical protein